MLGASVAYARCCRWLSLLPVYFFGKTFTWHVNPHSTCSKHKERFLSLSMRIPKEHDAKRKAQLGTLVQGQLSLKIAFACKPSI